MMKSETAPTGGELLEQGRQLLAAGLKPLTWHPEPKDGTWAKVPDLGRDDKRGWSFRAASDEAELAELVARHDAEHPGTGGIGVLLGQPSHALVLEADPRNGGGEAFARLCRDAGWNPAAAIAERQHVAWRSGRGDGGGGFLFARSSDEVAPLKALAARYPGVDVLDDGRFQVLPPSLHPDSLMRYAWRVPPGLELRPQLVPGPLLHLGQAIAQDSEQRIREATGGAVELPAVIGQGERDTLLTSFAGSMRKRGATEEEIFQMLLILNVRCQPPHSYDDIRRIARSVASYPAGADPELDQRLVEWAAKQGKKADESDSLIPTLEELVSSPEGLQALKRAALSERARMEIRAAKATAEFATPPAAQPLDFRLALPRPAIEWRLPGIWRRHHRVILAALYKTGKSMLAANAVASLVSGHPFLGGSQAVTPVKQVCWWNLEMDGYDADDYLAVTPPAARKKVRMAHLRETPVPFLRSAPAYEWALESLSGCQVWMVDTWGALCAWNGIDVNDNTGARELLAAMDALMGEAGVTELLMLAHMPHAGRDNPAAERALGAQSLSGWADCIWTYWRDDSSQRFLRAEGRGVTLEEFRVDLGGTGLNLVAQLGGRNVAASDTAIKEILDVLLANDMAGEARVPVGARILRERCHARAEAVTAAYKELLQQGILVNTGTGSKMDLRLTSAAGPFISSLKKG